MMVLETKLKQSSPTNSEGQNATGSLNQVGENAASQKFATNWMVGTIHETKSFDAV